MWLLQTIMQLIHVHNFHSWHFSLGLLLWIFIYSRVSLSPQKCFRILFSSYWNELFSSDCETTMIKYFGWNFVVGWSVCRVVRGRTRAVHKLQLIGRGKVLALQQQAWPHPRRWCCLCVMFILSLSLSRNANLIKFAMIWRNENTNSLS